MCDMCSERAAKCFLSPAKVNLTLRVVGVRVDGFHALDSVVVPIGLADEIWVARGAPGSGVAMSVSGWGVDVGALPADPEKNLAVRAVRLLERVAGRELPVQLTIRKQIPLGGGLGGGSSNAATVLRAVNDVWALGLPQERLLALGAELGSDVPLFVADGLARMRGRGEHVERWGGGAPLWLVLANDGTHCATPSVYGAYDQLHAKDHLLADNGLTNEGTMWDNLRLSLQSGEVSRVAQALGNDLEQPCFGLFPSVARTAEALRAAGCQGVTLCGSGATVFGLVQSREAGERALAHPALAGCWRTCIQTLPDGVMAAHGPLTPIVMVRIHVGQPVGC